MEGEAIVFHLVWKGRIASREVYHDPFQRRETWSSLIDDTHGFSLIDNENQNEFIDSFRKFEELDWTAVATDDGLDYKTYNKNRRSKHYFSDDLWKKGIRKFKITQRNRCFGYVDNGVFLCVEVWFGLRVEWCGVCFYSLGVIFIDIKSCPKIHILFH